MMARGEQPLSISATVGDGVLIFFDQKFAEQSDFLADLESVLPMLLSWWFGSLHTMTCDA